MENDLPVVVLENVKGDRAEICPALGFNCFRWCSVYQGTPREMLYAPAEFFTSGRPTRGGIPILFPFPNRIRGGAFSWRGRSYQLPKNDSTKANAIHGFACRRPWRVSGQGVESESAWVQAEFRCSQDDPANRPFWPADHEIKVTFRLGPGFLRIDTEIRNPDAVPLPFGLGFHPYFRLAGQDDLVSAPAKSFWFLEDSLPAGERKPVDAAHNLNDGRRAADLQLDDVLTDLPNVAPGSNGLLQRGHVQHDGVRLTLSCSADFRELVVFTPPHRQAFCIEPYTCTTDAVNLQARGVDAGWRELPPGGKWTAVVEMRVGPGVGGP
jgi:aldose 1-epimerase